MKRRQFKKILQRLDRIILLLSPAHAVSAHIALGVPTVAKKILNGKGRRGAPINFPQLASDGAVLQALDAGGNVVAGGIDPTKTIVAWSTSDTSVLTVAVPDPADTTKATVTSTGKIGSGVTITATLTNNDGSPPLPPAVSDPINVPAGPPLTAEIVLGVPA